MGLLRFLFALSVISAHTGPILGASFIGGKMAVQAFFMLSGFYMAMVLAKKYNCKGSFKLFITKRILRLYPTYWIVLIISVIVSFVFLQMGSESTLTFYKQYQTALNPLALGYLVLSQIFILGMDLVMFFGVDTVHKTMFFTNDYLNTHPQLYNFLFVPQAWTLSLEMVFYIFAPFLVKKKTRVLFFLIAVSLCFRYFLYYLGLHREPWTNRFFPTELVFFLIGILAYRLYIRIPFGKKKKVSVIFLLFLVGITLIYNSTTDGTPRSFDVLQLSYFGVLFLGIPFIFELTKRNTLDRVLGLLSYPVYISHELVILLLQHIGQTTSKFFGIEVVVVTALVSAILIILIENPINRYRQGRLDKKEFAM